jgi:hypothetical protein
MNARKEIFEKIEELEHYKIKYQKEMYNYKWTEYEKQNGSEYYGKLQEREAFYDSKILLLQWVLNLLKAEN